MCMLLGDCSAKWCDRHLPASIPELSHHGTMLWGLRTQHLCTFVQKGLGSGIWWSESLTLLLFGQAGSEKVNGPYQQADVTGTEGLRLSHAE